MSFSFKKPVLFRQTRLIIGYLCSKYERQGLPNLRLQGGIYAVLWNKYPVINRFQKPAEYHIFLKKCPTHNSNQGNNHQPNRCTAAMQTLQFHHLITGFFGIKLSITQPFAIITSAS